ncbi:hypothetical protein J6590_007457 [Homalodisca vitripennis]|nr:hypothetical protein J6590_007457 [Homalodisca vitripennis]
MYFVFTKVLVFVHLKLLVLLLTALPEELVGSQITVPKTFDLSPHHEFDGDYEYFENYTKNSGIQYGTVGLKTNLNQNCDSVWSECGPCEVCVYGVCKPITLNGVFDQNCSLINTCEENNTCGDNQCIPSFGKYVCMCPPQWFGENCQYSVQKEGDKIISRVMVFYSPHTLPLEPAKVLVTWLDSSPGSGDTQVVYSVASPDYIYRNKIIFGRFRFNLRTNPLTTCLSHFEDKFKQYCHFLPNDNSFTVLLFSTEFPFLPGYGGRRIFFGTQNRSGYTPVFNITIFTTIGEKLQEVYNSFHETFVYYRDYAAYSDICFPRDISVKNPCIINPGYKEPSNVPVVDRAVRKDLIDLSPYVDFKEVHCALTTSAKIWKAYTWGRAAEPAASCDARLVVYASTARL